MDNELIELEKHTETLITEFHQLKKINNHLQTVNTSLLEERDVLRAKTDHLSGKIKTIIDKLKSVEGTHDRESF